MADSINPVEDINKALISRPEKITALDVILETVTDNPALFNGRWWSIKDFRDKLMHEFDFIRLRNNYGDLTSLSNALVHAFTHAPWIQCRSISGLETEFRIATFPLTKPTNLPDCHLLIDHYRTIVMKWKQIAVTLHHVTRVARSMQLTTEDAAERLDRGIALAVLYRNHAKTLHERFLSEDSAFVDPSADDIKAVLDDPRKVLEVSELASLHGICNPNKG